MRSLLRTRCEANSILFAQLVKHTGLESGGQGQAIVSNVNVISSNPTATATANPKTITEVVAQAWAKVRGSRVGKEGRTS